MSHLFRSWAMIMRYVHHHHTLQGPASLTLQTTEVPEPQAGEIRIKVHFAGINRPDLLQRDGLYPAPSQASPHLGLEVSGWVDACGPHTHRFTPGQPICALTEGSGYAEYVTVSETSCLPVPDDSWLPAAACLPEACCTLWFNLFQTPRWFPGENILIHGGTSGLGSIAIQLAQQQSMTVFTTVRDQHKAEQCRQWGAYPILYPEENFVEVIRAQAHPRNVRTIIDIVGAPYLTDHLRLLAPHGHLICLGFMASPEAHVTLTPLITKQLTIHGSTLRKQSLTQKSIIVQGVHQDIWPLFLQRQLLPHIDQIYPLADYQAAHERLTHPARIGKILLNCLE